MDSKKDKEQLRKRMEELDQKGVGQRLVIESKVFSGSDMGSSDEPETPTKETGICQSKCGNSTWTFQKSAASTPLSNYEVPCTDQADEEDADERRNSESSEEESGCSDPGSDDPNSEMTSLKYEKSAGALFSLAQGHTSSKAKEILQSIRPTKVKTYQYDSKGDLMSTMSNFLNWIAQTSGATYKVLGISDNIILVGQTDCKICDTCVKLDQNKGLQETSFDKERVHPIQTTSSASPQYLSSKSLVLNIIPQDKAHILKAFKIGIKIPMKNQPHKKMMINLDTPGFEQDQIQHLLINDTSIQDVYDMLIKCFSKRKDFKLIKGLYDLNKYELS